MMDYEYGYEDNTLSVYSFQPTRTMHSPFLRNLLKNTASGLALPPKIIFPGILSPYPSDFQAGCSALTDPAFVLGSLCVPEQKYRHSHWHNHHHDDFKLAQG